MTEQLSQEKQNLSLTELELKTKLKSIEDETHTLLQEKSEAEIRFVLFACLIYLAKAGFSKARAPLFKASLA